MNRGILAAMLLMAESLPGEEVAAGKMDEEQKKVLDQCYEDMIRLNNSYCSGEITYEEFVDGMERAEYREIYAKYILHHAHHGEYEMLS